MVEETEEMEETRRFKKNTMFENWTAKKTLIAILIILAIGVIIYFVGKGAGKKYVPDDIVIPPDTQAPGTPGIYNPGPATDAIYEDLDEIWGYHESGPYIAANKLSNSQLAAIYNDWNKRYAKDFDSKTIIQAMEDESTVWNVAWTTIVGQLINRFKTLPGAQG